MKRVSKEMRYGRLPSVSLCASYHVPVHRSAQATSGVVDMHMRSIDLDFGRGRRREVCDCAQIAGRVKPFWHKPGTRPRWMQSAKPSSLLGTNLPISLTLLVGTRQRSSTMGCLPLGKDDREGRPTREDGPRCFAIQWSVESTRCGDISWQFRPAAVSVSCGASFWVVPIPLDSPGQSPTSASAKTCWTAWIGRALVFTDHTFRSNPCSLTHAVR